MPGEAGKVTPYAIPTDLLRAPASYFHPVQAGKKAMVDGNNRPGLGKKLTAVHPGYRLTNIRHDGMDMPVGGLGMLSDGRLVVARFDATTLVVPLPTELPNGELWLINNPPNHGSVWRVALSKPAGDNIEVLTGGHRTPNGIGLNTAGEAFVIDNQGGWTRANGQPQYQGLECLTPTGEEVFEILDMRATPTGFILTFTQPVPEAPLTNPDTYSLQQYT